MVIDRKFQYRGDIGYIGSHDCRDKLPQTQRFQITQIYDLTALWVGILSRASSDCGCIPSGA